MTELSVHHARCEALFASGLQCSDGPTAEAVAEAISRTVRRLGTGGCAGRMAQEFGDHPETAVERMRWVRQLVAELPASQRARPGPPRSGAISTRAARRAAGSVRRAA